VAAQVTAVFAISIGAALGALLRWWLGLRLNALHISMPLGTLAANLIGGFLVGVAIALFDRTESLVHPELRLFIITGFLGGLTTFSTYSAEVVTLLERGDYGWAGATAFAHLAGSLALTAAGIALVKLALR